MKNKNLFIDLTYFENNKVVNNYISQNILINIKNIIYMKSVNLYYPVQMINGIVATYGTFTEIKLKINFLFSKTIYVFESIQDIQNLIKYCENLK